MATAEKYESAWRVGERHRVLLDRAGARRRCDSLVQAGDGRAAVRGGAVPARQPGADLGEEGSGAGRGGGVRARTGEDARICSRGGGTPAFAGKSELTGELPACTASFNSSPTNIPAHKPVFTSWCARFRRSVGDGAPTRRAGRWPSAWRT